MLDDFEMPRGDDTKYILHAYTSDGIVGGSAKATVTKYLSLNVITQIWLSYEFSNYIADCSLDCFSQQTIIYVN